MNTAAVTDSKGGEATSRVSDTASGLDYWLATLAATLLPVSLIWDYSWESTVGVDRIWAPPHLATHLAVWVAAWVGLKRLIRATIAGAGGVNIGPLRAPSGAWLLLWAALAFQTAFLFDNWWQRAYGLGAGIWHPPQILKAIAFVALQLGVIVSCAPVSLETGRRQRLRLLWNAGMFLVLAGLMMGTTALANAQHAAQFYKLTCVCFPVILMLGAVVTGGRWRATLCALAYLLVAGVMVWVLPLFPAKPLTGPVHNPMNHLMPPAFPLLLVIPAIGLDFVTRKFSEARGWKNDIKFAALAGAGFVALFAPTQWFFARFLLSPAADNWFFAGGGRHWPFFLKIDEARVMFWRVRQDPLDVTAIIGCLALATASALVGIYAGKRLRRLQR